MAPLSPVARMVPWSRKSAARLIASSVLCALTLVATSTGATAKGQASLSTTPKLVVRPTAIAAGGTVTLTGSGFPANTETDIDFAELNCRCGGSPKGTVTTDSSGGFLWRGKISASTAGGWWEFWAFAGDSAYPTKAHARVLVVTPNVKSGPAVGPRLAKATLRFGKGLGIWRMYMKRVVVRGLKKTEVHESPGPCVGSPSGASIIDYYPGLRLSWDGVGLGQVATTVRGVRDQFGFRIGKSTLAQVRRRNPKQVVRSVKRSRYSLGATVLQISRKTGIESIIFENYWFNRPGRLIAIETGFGGC